MGKIVNKKISKNDSIKIINNQINLLKKRDVKFAILSRNKFENFTYMESIN